MCARTATRSRSSCTLRAALAPPCAHADPAPTCTCITSLDFLVPSPLLKSIINEIKQLRVFFSSSFFGGGGGGLGGIERRNWMV